MYHFAVFHFTQFSNISVYNFHATPFCDEKSVELVRVASFQSDFLQNPYYRIDFFLLKKCSEQLTNSVRLFFRTSYTTDLFLFIIGHFFLSSIWSSNIRNFVQKWGFEFFNCKTLKTVNHWFGLLSWICFTISHSLSSCLCFIFWHFSEHILSPHLALQSDKSIPVREQLAQKFGVKLWGGPVIKGHSSKMISSLCTRTNQL